MKLTVALFLTFSALSQIPARAEFSTGTAEGEPFLQPPVTTDTKDRWRQITCYVKDSKGITYSAWGYGPEARVKRAALRHCHYNSTRPSTCRLLRCLP